MKFTIFLGTLWFLAINWLNPATKPQGWLAGKVSDDTEALIGANVKVFKNKELVRGAVTDYEGNYKIAIDTGTYEVEFSYVGYETERKEKVKIEAGKTLQLDMVMKAGTTLSEVVIVTGKAPVVEKDHAMSAHTIKKESAKTSRRDKRADAAKPAAPAEPASTDPPAYSLYGETKAKGKTARPPAEAEDIIEVDGKLMRAEIVFEPETYEEKIRLVELDKEDVGETLADEILSPGASEQPRPKAGLLTAGEWNDLHNWNTHWVDLLADGEIQAYETMYGFFPEHRYTLMISNQEETPMADLRVQLKRRDEVIWEARTDNTGKVELWAGIYDAKDATGLSAEFWLDGKKQTLKNLKPAAKGFNFVKVKAPCAAPSKVDIVWAVDATGSMGDELEYLKTELLDVITRAQRKNAELEYRMGSVFYRDEGDEYTVRSSPLTKDIHQTIDFIKKQSAAGGGDYPEAVHSALEDVVYRHQWSENALARICFLVLDASPHDKPEVRASLQKTIREAARLGIRIVPLAGSGIQKDTEFLMKFFGLATNGSYLFLTDHSGIGGKHLEPTTDEYKVEPLNDLLVRIITEYTSVKSCEGKTSIRFEDDPQQPAQQIWEASYYPNPAIDQFTLDLPVAVEYVALYNSEGQGVSRIEKPEAGQHNIQVQDLPAGFYTIRIMSNGRMQSGKLMVIRN